MQTDYKIILFRDFIHKFFYSNLLEADFILKSPYSFFLLFGLTRLRTISLVWFSFRPQFLNIEISF